MARQPRKGILHSTDVLPARQTWKWADAPPGGSKKESRANPALSDPPFHRNKPSELRRGNLSAPPPILFFLNQIGSVDDLKPAVALPANPRRSEAAVPRKRLPEQHDLGGGKKGKPGSGPANLAQNPKVPAPQHQPSGPGSLGGSFLNESEQYDGPFRKVKPGDRPKSILITWSDTKKGEYRRPSTKQGFMKIVGDVLEEAQDTKCGPQSTVNLRACQVAIFEELHADLTKHLHCMVAFPEKTSVGSYVGNLLLERGIATDVRGPAASSGATPAAHRFLAYCVTASEEKWLTDDAPLLYNLQIPLNIADAAARAQKRLSKKPADMDALYCYLAQHPEIVKPEQFDATLNSHCFRRGVHKHYHIPYTRLRLLAPKLGRAFPEEFHAQLNRVRAQRVDPGAPYSSFYEDALQSECECKKPGELLARVIEGVEFRDQKEYYPSTAEYKSSRSHLGAYYGHLIRDDFPARQQVLCVIGEQGSGKSVAASQHLNVFPRGGGGACNIRAAFVFKPTLDDTFPFTVVPPMVEFIDFNDFRTSLQNFSPSTVLNLGEFLPTKVAQKSGAAVEVQARLCLTANYFTPSGRWKQIDVDAMLGSKGRVFGGPLTWKHPLPTHSSCGGQCRSCASRFMQWCMNLVSPSAPPALCAPPSVQPPATPATRDSPAGRPADRRTDQPTASTGWPRVCDDREELPDVWQEPVAHMGGFDDP